MHRSDVNGSSDKEGKPHVAFCDASSKVLFNVVEFITLHTYIHRHVTYCDHADLGRVIYNTTWTDTSIFHDPFHALFAFAV